MLEVSDWCIFWGGTVNADYRPALLGKVTGSVASNEARNASDKNVLGQIGHGFTPINKW